MLGTRFRGADYRVELGVGGHTVVAITHRPPAGRVGITVDPNGVSLVP